MLHHRDGLEAEVHGIVQGLSLGKFIQEELFAYVSLTLWGVQTPSCQAALDLAMKSACNHGITNC